MDHLEFLFAGFAVFWAGLFAYLLWLQARLRAVIAELGRLEERLAATEHPATSTGADPAGPASPASSTASPAPPSTTGGQRSPASTTEGR